MQEGDLMHASMIETRVAMTDLIAVLFVFHPVKQFYRFLGGRGRENLKG